MGPSRTAYRSHEQLQVSAIKQILSQKNENYNIETMRLFRNSPVFIYLYMYIQVEEHMIDFSSIRIEFKL